MKSKLMRLLSMIMVFSFLLSMFTVFAFAEDETVEDETQEETEESGYEILYNRTYDEGWGVANGMNYTANGSAATTFEIEYETTMEYEYNYFWRLEIGATANSFMQMNIDDTVPANGAVLELDIKSDDICYMPNVVNLGTIGASAAIRSDYQLISVKDNQVYILDGGDYMDFRTEEMKAPICSVGNEWLRFKFVFDYTYEINPVLEGDPEDVVLEKRNENGKWFRLYVYYGLADSEEPLTLWTGAPLVLQGQNGKGIQMLRFQASGAKEENFGTSLCFDNIKFYRGTNELQNITPDMGYGRLVDEFAAKTENIIGGSADNAGTAFNKALAMKVGVDYCYYNAKRIPIATTADGEAYAAPTVHEGKIFVELTSVLDYLGYPLYVHPDGMYIDISTGTSATYLVVGKNTATVAGETVQLSSAPTYITDRNGNEYLAIELNDVDVLFPGVYSDYDDMGLIMIGYVPDLLQRDVNMKSMISLMKSFVFDLKSGEDIYADVEAHTNGFQHPYLFGGPEAVQTLRDEYLALNVNRDVFVDMDNNYSGIPTDYPEEFWMWVHYERLVWYADDAYERYAVPDGDGTYDTFVELSDDSARNAAYSLEQPYISSTTIEANKSKNGYNDGYDIGGRSDIANRTQFLERMAFGYALTHDVKYLQCSYEIALELSKWTHWGPGHFLNCADSSADYATYYDLTYNGYKELIEQGITRPNGEPYSTDVLAEILYRQGVEMGYLTTFYYKQPDENGVPFATLFAPYLSNVVGLGGSYYSERDNNWHAVCVSGMGAAALAIMGEADGAFAYKTSRLLSENLKSLTAMGLDIYAPDGSYIEGPGYWDYGTNQLFRLCMMLDSAAGTNYGLMDAWGIDKTCYYACHTESSDGRTFNFADGGMSQQNSSFFFYVGNYFNDVTLYDVRLNQISNNLKNATFVDLIYYPRDLDISANAVQLDYMPDSNDIFATRSGWAPGSLYAGIAGGINKFGHGQIDAGSFVYHNNGNVWIHDLGTEDYNATGFWGAATRYRFYVMKPEGNNTLAIASDVSNVPYGQILDSTAPAIASGSNEYGAYVVYDMRGTFGPRANYWTRGMMLTNDRKTTIIQDQLTLDSMQDVYWFAHYVTQRNDPARYGVEKVQISTDGRTAYLQQYKGKDEHGRLLFDTLRLSIVSDNPSFKFTIMDAYTTIHTDPLTGTYPKGFIATQGSGVPEKDRSMYRKLAIASGKVIKFDVAVVIEMVDTDTIGTADEIDVGYEFTNMNTWVPTADMRGEVDDSATIERRGTPNINNHLVRSMNVADAYVTGGMAYNSMIFDYYRALTDAYYVVRMLGIDLPANYRSYKDTLNKHKSEFDTYTKEVTNRANTNAELVYKLMGLN